MEVEIKNIDFLKYGTIKIKESTPYKYLKRFYDPDEKLVDRDFWKIQNKFAWEGAD